VEKHDVMIQPSENNETDHRCYALCVGIGAYSNLSNRNLRYTVADAKVIADRLADPQRGNFAVTVLNEPTQTTKEALDEAVTHVLSTPGRRTEDLALLYFSCHGDINPTDDTFCLLPSNASLQTNGQYNPTTLIGIADFARWFANATIQNIVVLLDVCHSGGAGAALQQFTLKLDTGPNFFFIGAARLDQAARQSSRLQHGLFTYCLLRAFEQPPTSDGWLTVSQIHTFISDELPWFTKEHPTHIQSWSVSVNPNMPLVRNPGYPELAPLPPVWNVPLQRNVFFTGQEELLSQLASMLRGTQKTALTQPHALSGLGGIGKTQLALEYAYQHRQDYHAVLWGRAESTEALTSTFLEIAQVLDLPQKNEPDQTVIIEAVKTWLSHRPQWLFILDNADDVGLVQAFLPPAFRGHLLLTTRAQAMGRIVESKLAVEAMRPETGALLLLHQARIVSKETALEEAPDKVVIQAKELAKELGGLPLALDQAGAYIEATGCSLANYQQQYQTRRSELLALRNGPTALPRAWKDDHPESVATTWAIAFEQVQQSNPAAADLLRLCAFLHSEAIPEDIIHVSVEELPPQYRERAAELPYVFRRVVVLIYPFLLRNRELTPDLQRAVADPLQWNEAISVLRRFSLIDRQAETRTLSLHRLVQAVLQDDLSTLAWRAWAERAIRLVSRAFPNPPDFVNWERCQQVLPHAIACTSRIEQWHLPFAATAASLLTRAGYYLKERARYTEALSLYHEALKMTEQGYSPTHPQVATALNNLAELHRTLGWYREALPLFQRALAIREKVLRSTHPLVALSLNNLALLYTDQERYEEALPLLQRALAIREQVIGPNHPDVAASLNNLALLYKALKQYREALPFLQQALAIHEQVLGPNHPDVAISLDNLALLYSTLGQYAEALPLYRRALAIKEKGLGLNHPDVAISLNNLALLYFALGQYAEAIQLTRQALAIYEQVLPDHPTTATLLDNLAAFLHKIGQEWEAHELEEAAHIIRRKHQKAHG
jgi:tetratricopeptide (TPR) repeat protein